MQLNGSQIVLECLKEQGVDTVFGYPGGAILNIYDALYKEKAIKHFLTAHEQGASHAADGYARATGKVGVCLATSGPGATNLVTGIATAMMDSIPMVAITANVGFSLIGKDSFQEIDITGITLPITKHNFFVNDVTQLAGVIRRAFKIAQSGRKGPVLVDITKDVTAAICEFEPQPKVVLDENPKVKEEQINTIIDLIQDAKRPFVLVGGGAVKAKADEEVRRFVKMLDAPVSDTLMGKGVIEYDNPLYCGMIGMHGTKAANIGLMESDLLINIGARFDDRVTGDTSKFASKAKVVHIDIDYAEIDKNILTHGHAIGDAREVVAALLEKMTKHSHPEWVSYVKNLYETYPLDSDKKENLNGPFVVSEISRLSNGEAFICTDVGQHQMWAAQYFKFKRSGQFATSGGLGTMGYGLGAAIGAQCGLEKTRAVNITGDGCFRMNLNELATASRYQIPIIEVIINNKTLGMVRQWQHLFYEDRFSHTTFEDKVDFVKVAQALGVKAQRVTTKEEFSQSFQQALESNEPMVIECMVDRDDRIFPMVAAGAALDMVFDEKDLE